MPYSAHTLAVVYGTLLEATGQPTEIWQVGVRLTGVTDLDAYADAIIDTVHQWWVLSDNLMSTSAILDGIKVAAVTATGTAPAIDRPASDHPTGPSAATLPNFCSVAITWETADPKSKGGRGRIYPPIAPTFTGSSILTNKAANCASAGVSLLDALTGGQTLQEATPVVASKVYGTLKPIVAASADCIIDTQRRRRNQLVEFRQTQPYPS